MDIQRAIMEKVKALPDDKQQEVLDFIEFIQQKEGVKRPRRSLKGLWADLGVGVSKQDVAEMRREIQENFPREDI